MNIAIYTRKSIYSDKSDSTEAQFKIALNYCEMHFKNYTLYRYEDEGFTGANTKRPEFQRLVEDINAGFISVVMCYKIDRISRNVKDFSEFFDLLEKKNIIFVSTKENIDTGTPAGRAMMYMTSVFAQMERETIAERIRDNSLELAKSGKWAGGKAPTGYKIEKIIINGKKHSMLVIDPDAAEWIKNLFDTFLAGKYTLSGLETYFRQNNIKTPAGSYFSSTQIHTLLSNPTYVAADQDVLNFFKSKGSIIGCSEASFTGATAVNPYNRTSCKKPNPHTKNSIDKWIISVGLHEPIISSEQWLAVQARFNGNLAYRKRKYNVGILRGVLKCSCGRSMVTKHKFDKQINKDYFYYSCPKKDRQGTVYCNQPNIPIDDIDTQVINILKDIKVNKNSISRYMVDSNFSAPTFNAKKKHLEKTIKDNEVKLNNLVSSLSGSIDSTASKYIIQEIERIDKILSSTHSELSQVNLENIKHTQKEYSKTEKRSMIIEFLDSIDDMTYEEINEFLKSIILECRIEGDKLLLFF